MPSSSTWNSTGSKTSVSNPFPVSISGSTTNYTVKTESNIDNNQNVTASKLTLQDTVTSRSGSTERALATSVDGGKTWTPTTGIDGKPILTSTQLSALTQGGSLYTAARNATQADARTNGATTQQLNQLNNGNLANTPKEEDQQGPITTEVTPLANENQLEIVPRGGRIQYPKLMKNEQDKIKFTACKIKPRTTSGEGLGFKFQEPSYEVVAGSVFLAIQSPISDQNSVDWGPDTVNAIDAAIFKASYDIIKPDNLNATGVDDKLKQAYQTAMSNTDRIKRFLAGQAASLNNVLARTDNVVLNPNLELLFQGPQLRPFTFTFKMSARNQPEADEIKKIIKYFKYHMAVRKETGLFLRAPHVFTIQYMKGEEPQHPGLNLISPSDDKKACALTNCSVDYTPLGTYATYEDGTMVAYTLSLQFQELTPIYDTDYTETEHPIGY